MVEPQPEEEEIFHAARRLAPSEREAFLEQRCGADRALRARVMALLGVLEQGDSFLEQLLQEGGAGESTAIEGPGSSIGPYHLIERIGEGGFGEVFLAEQHAPLRRRVALKVIKPGMDTRQVIARFEAERQALALMEHENIARVLDGGETAAGRPYFVMELVRGIPITDYCDQERLSVPERLELFASVCFAVQHAHQKGVIHRDLKPSNVLVSRADGKPAVKVIDFGIAKAIGQQLSDRTLVTGVAQMIGTPMYMSPEQAGLSGLDVDTRADVYALGVLLYELVTGTTPFDRERLGSAAFEEIRRIIREDEPAKPSTRVSTLSAGASTLSVRSVRDPARLRRLLSGELDWIVLKCLEKDRARRYETASGLAHDVLRFLASEPVEAGPPSAGYRLRKLLVRHRTAVATAVVVLLVLVGGIVGTTGGLMRAMRAEGETRVQRDKAVASAQSAQKRLSQVERGVEILRSIFRGLTANSEEAEGKPLRVLLGERLEQAARELDGESVGDPLVVARLQSTLGDSLLELGYADRSVEILSKARTTLAAELGAADRETIDCIVSLAMTYRSMGKLEQALPIALEALEHAKAALGEDDPYTIDCLSAVAGIHVTMGNLELALPMLEEVLERRKEVLGEDDQRTIIAMNNLATADLHAGKFAEAAEIATEAMSLGEQNLGHDHTTVLGSLSTLAQAHQASGRLDLALPLEEEVWKRSLAKLGPDHPWTLMFLNNLGSGYLLVGKYEQAEPVLARAAAQLEKLEFACDNVQVIIDNLESCLQRLNRLQEAEPWRRKVLAAEKKRGVRSVAYADALAALAAHLVSRGQWSAAEPHLIEGIELLKSLAGPPDGVALDPQGGGTGAAAAANATSGAHEGVARRLREALGLAVRLYAGWGKGAEASRWQRELDDMTRRAR